MGRKKGMNDMEIQLENRALAITGLCELDGASSRAFQRAVGMAAKLGLATIEVDLSEVRSVDASALGALAYLYRLAGGHASLGVAPVRLLNPQPGVQQMLELARMDQLFEVVITPAPHPQAEHVPPEDLLKAA
jgi:anti-anti-sigma factor